MISSLPRSKKDNRRCLGWLVHGPWSLAQTVMVSAYQSNCFTNLTRVNAILIFLTLLLSFLIIKKLKAFFFSVLLSQKGRSWRIRLLRLRRVFSIQSLSCLMSLTMTMMLMLSPGSILSILICRTMGGDLLYV